jgi:hypothetical protein
LLEHSTPLAFIHNKGLHGVGGNSIGRKSNRRQKHRDANLPLEPLWIKRKDRRRTSKFY